MSGMQVLEPSDLDLRGRALIEASAGTGKTYTIASLYLRYIVEQPLEQELSPEKILVVTFTRAATAELRDRIRARLHFAVACFKGKDPQGDSVVAQLLHDYAEQKDRVLKRLYAAEKTMDDAAIYTIHSFCHRALRQNSVTTGQLNDLQLIEDQRDLIMAAVQDFWRNAIYPLSHAQYMSFKKASKLDGPEALFKEIYPLLARKNLSSMPLAQNETAHTVILSELENVQEAWKTFTHVVLNNKGVIDEVASLPRLNSATISKHYQAIVTASEAMQSDKALSDAIEYIEEKVQKAAEQSYASDHGERILAAWAALQSACVLDAQLKAQVLHYVSIRVTQEKQRLQLQAADDFMSNLVLALNAEQGDTLAQALRKQYPVALIDEFQDTDPLQYEIFSRIYADNLAPEHYSWLMIGDPKQSIYAFRGADIDTYVAAKHATENTRQYTLEKNYRSSQGMVEAVNALFSFHARPAFINDAIPFQRVSSHDKGEKGSICIDGQTQSALQLAIMHDESNGESHCAEQISQLLNLSAEGRATLGTGEKQRAIKQGDFAVLVRSRFEAAAVAEALRKRHIRSVFQTRDSVFNSDAAVQLLRVVEGFFNPRDERSLMAALSIAFAQFSAAQLSDIRNNESLWQNHQSQFAYYQQRWQRHGILRAVSAWMDDYHIASRVLSDTLSGERNIADLIHCAELLQRFSMQEQGMHTLLRYFRAQVANDEMDASGAQLRQLESDKDLVKIVTIHASKGLEYPIVMLPFGLSEAKARQSVVSKQGRALVDFTGDETLMAQAQEQQLAEDLRLLYVALTRAGFACYVALCGQKAIKQHTALGYLLGMDEHNDEALITHAQRLALENGHVIDCAPALSTLSLCQYAPESAAQDLSARPFTGQIDKQWRMSSYTALAANIEHEALRSGAEDEQEHVNKVQDIVPVREVQPYSALSFARGSEPGNFLHDVLEHAFNSGEYHALGDYIAPRLAYYGLDDSPQWVEGIEHWLRRVLNNTLPLGEARVRLSELNRDTSKAEMEFMLSVGNVLDAKQFNALLAQQPLLDCAIGALGFQRFKGLLKGYIDLCFCHEGRYYVCDYKSNYLGDGPEDYSQANMHAAMADHRYDAQLIIYTLALHRLLKRQLRDYDYEKHMGGGVYLFLRGIDAQQNDSGVCYLRPSLQLIEQLDQLLG